MLSFSLSTELLSSLEADPPLTFDWCADRPLDDYELARTYAWDGVDSGLGLFGEGLDSLF
jgi:hypothetical protein